MPGKTVRCGQAERHGRRWRVAEIAGDGTRTHCYFEGPDAERDARLYVAAFRAETKDRSLGSSVTEYLDHLARFGGAKRRPLKPNSLKIVRSKLEGLLQLVDPDLRKGNRGVRRPVDLPMTDRPLKNLTPELAQRLYSARVSAVKSNGVPISADTHRSELIYAHAFGGWCEEQGYLRCNPFARVMPEGELSKGKDQLMITEARAFLRSAYSDEHPTQGVAAAAVLTLGVRANEILDRRVRDLDDGGRVLWIPFGKTEASKRRLAVPPVLRAALLKLAEGQGPDAYLFGPMTDGTLLKYVRKTCGVLGITGVCTHGLRGTQITLTVAIAQDVERASRAAGHATTGVTRAHYMAAGVEQSSRAALMEEILLSDTDDKQAAADLAEAEREMAAAQAKLAALKTRGAVTLSLGTRPSSSYPEHPSGDLTN
jgi:integrase